MSDDRTDDRWRSTAAFDVAPELVGTDGRPAAVDPAESATDPVEPAAN